MIMKTKLTTTIIITIIVFDLGTGPARFQGKGD